MSFYYSNVKQLAKMLGNVDSWLDKAEAFAKAKNFDVNVLLQARLAPDQYPLVRQLQAVCDGPKFLAARLAGKEPPKHPDTETTLAELRTRLRAVREYLEGFKASDFEGSDARVIALPFMPGKGMAAADYVTQMALPNVYFHLGHSYAILRHNGVDLGKMDYIGAIDLKDL
ncbi:MAG: DUF1993 domain-containing protein [Polyangiales bacterium]